MYVIGVVIFLAVLVEALCFQYDPPSESTKFENQVIDSNHKVSSFWKYVSEFFVDAAFKRRMEEMAALERNKREYDYIHNPDMQFKQMFGFQTNKVTSNLRG